MLKKSIMFAAAALVLTACGSNTDKTEQKASKPESRETSGTASEKDAAKSATATFINADGKEIGTAELTEADNGVRVKVEASQLPPGNHGFHFHEKGSCTAPNFESAGGHFNPEQAEHGIENPKGPHAGDLPNIEVGESGAVKFEALAQLVTLKKGQPNSLLREGGTALVIHADPDDYKSQPAGNSGKRIACGEIKE